MSLPGGVGTRYAPAQFLYGRVGVKASLCHPLRVLCHKLGRDSTQEMLPDHFTKPIGPVTHLFRGGPLLLGCHLDSPPKEVDAFSAARTELAYRRVRMLVM